ncbi:MAG: HD domain-containing phosphohydrolase [Bacteroidota bacterium]
MHLLSRILSNREQRLFKDLLKALSLVLDLALDQKQQHSLRVAVACVQLGAEAGLPSKELRDLFYAGLLHDIGDIGSDDPAAGARIVSLIPTLEAASGIIRFHHEFYDGTGPEGLLGESIPLPAQVLALCDAADSLVQSTGPLGSQPVLHTLQSWRGTRFSRELTDLYQGLQSVWNLEELGEKQWKVLKLDVIDLSYLIDLQVDYLELTLKVFASIIDTKHRYTQGHSQRVAEFARLLARTMGLGAEAERQVYYAGFLHDAGKVAVPAAVLDKPSKLTDTEWALIAEHPRKSKRIIEEISSLEAEAVIAGYHHERWDGRGYPFGLKGEDIPLGSRIMAVVDSYDAMTSTRPYRVSLSHADAVAELQRCAGSMYDPTVVEFFLDLSEDAILRISQSSLH